MGKVMFLCAGMKACVIVVQPGPHAPSSLRPLEKSSTCPLSTAAGCAWWSQQTRHMHICTLIPVHAQAVQQPLLGTAMNAFCREGRAQCPLNATCFGKGASCASFWGQERGRGGTWLRQAPSARSAGHTLGFVLAATGAAALALLPCCRSRGCLGEAQLCQTPPSTAARCEGSTLSPGTQQAVSGSPVPWLH